MNRKLEKWFDWRFENAETLRESCLVFKDYFHHEIKRWFKWKRVAVKIRSKGK